MIGKLFNYLILQFSILLFCRMQANRHRSYTRLRIQSKYRRFDEEYRWETC